MNLRQRIKHELENFHSGVEYRVISTEQFNMALDAYTDRILAEVREALLSDKAVEAAIGQINDNIYVDVDSDGTRWPVHNDHYAAPAALAAALDAVTGEGDR